MSYNAYALPRMTREKFTRDLESILQPGTKLTITLQKCDGLDSAQMVDRWTEADQMYRTGEHENCTDGPMQVPGLDEDESSRISLSLIQNAAAIEAMQPESEGKINLETLMVIAARDEDMWGLIQQFAMEVNMGKAQTQGLTQ